jgi:hypothetical protein
MDDQCRVAVFHRPLQPDLSGERHGPEVVEVEDDQREAGTTGEQIGGAQRRAETACTLHPEQRGEIDAGRRGGGGIERIHPVHVGHLPASRDPGDEGQEQAAAAGGSGADDLAEPTRREQPEQAVDPFTIPPWRR